MANHTSNPWRRTGNLIYALEHDSWRKGVEQLRNRFSAQVEGHREIPPEELEANIRLITSAPDLVEALAGWMVGAALNGAYLPDDMREWASSILQGKTRTPAEVTRAIMEQLEEAHGQTTTHE